MSTNILSERSSNIPISPEKKDTKDPKKEAPAPAPKSLEYHRQMLESRLKEDKLVPGISLQSSSSLNTDAATGTTGTTNAGVGVGVTKVVVPGIAHAHHLVALSSSSQTYVSPSDTIQSPATQKLAAFRTKHIKAAKPRSLFAKTTAKNAGDLASTSTSTTSSQESQKDME
ncbi:hypothetical protein FKW77_009065 [Venturia effusa]|uniref:Uncharacterized protein n=1 Tax=Venturia effusa TaxID=50376 RepID=A0A517L3Z0_9PEZI|nr:hypothetical protein FKW77_009065 [Venturia effusa]